ncbi:MAG: AraC family transcriptional regulator [Myxococcota bacterium]
MRASTHASYRARIDRARAWLEDHLVEDVRPADLAKVAHFSPHHFHRVFRGVTGESVMECVRRLRLEKAARALHHTDAAVLSIALESGFSSHEGFTRAFTAHFGCSPTVYRARPPERIAQSATLPPLEPADVDVRTVGAMSMVCMGHQGSFSEASAVWENFIGRISAEGLFDGSQQLMGRYPDDPEVTPPDRMRFDVGMQSSDTSPLPPPLFRRSIPAGRWAVTVHAGSYETLSQTYLRLVGGWFPATGTPLGEGPCLEFYLNLPHEVSVEALRTEVWAPIRT